MRRVIWLLLPLSATPALAHSTRYQPASCERAIDAAQQVRRLPTGLLNAVAIVESGRPNARTGAVTPWPWTVNVEGQGFFFTSKAAAITAVQELEAAGLHSIDVGCLQVNLMYHPAAFTNLEQAFDPMANARYAASFLTVLYERSQDWSKAVADYHSQTPSIGASYKTKVLANWHPPAGTVRRYADFLPRTAVYRDFRSGAYADFAGAPDQPSSR
jgi:hypothetical protein